MTLVDLNRGFLLILIVALIGVIIVLMVEDLFAEVIGLFMAIGGAIWVYKEARC